MIRLGGKKRHTNHVQLRVIVISRQQIVSLDVFDLVWKLLQGCLKQCKLLSSQCMTEVIVLRYEYMKYMLNISDVLPQVRVEYTSDRGRHLRAARALHLGEVSFCIKDSTYWWCVQSTCTILM